MHNWVINLCRIVIAVGMGSFVAGWIVCAKIQSDALDQPLQAQGAYIHPLPMKRAPDRYITQDQQQMLTIFRPVIMVSWIFGLAGFLVVGAVDDARRDRKRKHDDVLEPF
jgi:hypothetical protein